MQVVHVNLRLVRLHVHTWVLAELCEKEKLDNI